MSEHQLEVILKMRDEASKKIEQFSQKVENEMKKAGETMVSFSRQMTKIGKDMTIIGAAITGPLGLAFKTTSDYSIEASETLKRLDDSAKAFQITIGTALLPVVEKVSNVIAALTKWFEQLDPKMRDAILQGALMTGILLTLGGALTYIIGKVIDLGGRLLLFAKAHPILLLIDAALILMVMNWEKVRNVAVPVLNAIEMGVTTVAIGTLKAADTVLTLADAFGGLPQVLKRIIEAIVMAFGLPASFATIFTNQIDKIKIDTQSMHESIKTGISVLEGNLVRSMETGKGAITSFVDSGLVAINKLMNALGPETDDALQNFSQNFSKVWTQAYEQAVNLGQQSAQIFVSSIQQLSTGIGTAVSDMIFKGKNFGESMKQVALQMAQTFISSIVAMIAQFLIFQAIQAAFFPLIVAVGSTAAAALAEIWAPAAALVSLATLGANAIPAAAAIASTVAVAQAAAVPLAEGGIVTRPTLALIGERGPEAIVPLNRNNSYSKASEVHINVEINGPVIRDETDIDTLVLKISQELARESDRIR